MSKELYNFTWQNRDDGTNRVFLQGPQDACPIGCAYCYISHRGAEPDAYDLIRLDDTVDTIIGDEKFNDETTVSLGCDTDPLLPQLLPGTIRVLGRFASGTNPLQLASKLKVPDQLVEFSHKGELGRRPPVFSVSLSTIRLAHQLEPLAPSPKERAINFDILRDTMGWNSIALIKPFMKTALEEVDDFISLFNEHTPDSVVVGSKFRRGNGNGAEHMHSIATTWSRQNQDDAQRQMSDELQKALPYTFVTNSSVYATKFIQN